MNQKGSKHMTLEQRKRIEENLKVNSTCKHISIQIGMDERSVSREIKLRRNKEKNGKYNIYGKRDESICPRIKRFPFVCNGCERRPYCFREYKYLYNAQLADENYRLILTDARVGHDFTLEEKELFDKTLEEGVKNGQSIYHIVTNNPTKIQCSVSTSYRLVNENKTIIQRYNLRRAVKLKPRKHYAYKEDNRSVRDGRKYLDFLRAISTAPPNTILTQMDTVEGPRNQRECLLTLHITNTHFMFAFILEDKNTECVAKVFAYLRKQLGIELYKRMFQFLLTDRGTEFCDPSTIEIDPETGEVIAHVFFCNAYSSYQKGAIEENHTLLRYIIPKKTYFGHLNQESVNLMLSHVNSYSRKSLDATPFELTAAFLGEDAVKKTKIGPIPSDLVNVTTKLLK